MRVITASPDLQGHSTIGPQAISTSKYTSFWISTTDHQYLLLEVMSCAEAHIALTDLPGLVTSHAYEIRLGENDNQQSGIYSHKGDEYCHSSNASPLSCTEYVHLWVSWADGFIKVGTGRLPGNNMFLNCEVDDFGISALSFASDRGNGATWIFEEILGNSSKIDHQASHLTACQIILL